MIVIRELLCASADAGKPVRSLLGAQLRGRQTAEQLSGHQRGDGGDPRNASATAVRRDRNADLMEIIETMNGLASLLTGGDRPRGA
jgi:hypothetical protein